MLLAQLNEVQYCFEIELENAITYLSYRRLALHWNCQ